MSSETGTKLRSGFAWSFIENISLQVTRFIVGIIMARILTPTDYGLIGMLTVFVVVSDLLVNSGFGSALNQKKDRTEKDFSTVFFFNFIIGIICYIVLYIFAPHISNFYNEPRLVSLLRWMSSIIVIKSLSIVPTIKMQINLRFNTISIISLASAVVLGVSGISFAYKGFGVWSLVYSNIIGTSFSLMCYSILTKWMPKTFFSFNSFRTLFAYGSRLLLASFIDIVYNNIYPLVIGKVYSAKQLGYYSRAQGYSNLPTGTLSSMVYRVCFPIFCKEKENYDKLIEYYSTVMQCIAYIIIPIMMMLLLLSKQLVILLITDKWLPCVVLLQILCLSSMWLPMMEVNYAIIKALGQSKLILKMQLISKVFAVIVLLVTTRFSIEIMCIGAVIVSLLNVFLNFILSKKVIRQSLIQQFRAILIPVTGGGIMLVAFSIMRLFDNLYLQLFAGMVSSTLIYLLTTSVLGLSAKKVYLDIKNI